MVKFQSREITDIAAVFCNWNNTTCFSVFERKREERDWGKLVLSFGDEIERQYYRTRRSHSHSCSRYDFLCDKISLEDYSLAILGVIFYWICFSFVLQQFVEEKMVGMMKNIPLCFSFLDLQGLVNFSVFWNIFSLHMNLVTKHTRSDIALLMTVTFHYSLWTFLPVGKTELAKQVARCLHKDNRKVVQDFFSIVFG